MKIKSGLKKSKKLFTYLVGLGLLLMAAGAVLGGFMKDDSLGSRIIGFGAGFGSAIVAVAAVNLILLRRNPDARREQEINEKDERHINIRERSAYNTFFVTTFSLFAAAFVFMCLDYWVSCFITIGLLFIHCISYFVFLHHNSKRL